MSAMDIYYKYGHITPIHPVINYDIKYNVIVIIFRNHLYLNYKDESPETNNHNSLATIVSAVFQFSFFIVGSALCSFRCKRFAYFIGYDKYYIIRCPILQVNSAE